MRTIAIARLKATLSAELKRVRAGESIVVLDRTTPVALLSPLPEAVRVSRTAKGPYKYRKLAPLTSRDPSEYLAWERGDTW